MKKLSLICAILFLLTCLAPARLRGTYLGYATVVNCNEWVTLRSSPSARTSSVCKVPLGASVEAYYYNSEFSECYYLDLHGYILNSYLSTSSGGWSRGEYMGVMEVAFCEKLGDAALESEHQCFDGHEGSAGRLCIGLLLQQRICGVLLQRPARIHSPQVSLLISTLARKNGYEQHAHTRGHHCCHCFGDGHRGHRHRAYQRRGKPKTPCWKALFIPAESGILKCHSFYVRPCGGCSGETLDEMMAVLMRALGPTPGRTWRKFTCHGGRASASAVLSRALAWGHGWRSRGIHPAGVPERPHRPEPGRSGDAADRR